MPPHATSSAPGDWRWSPARGPSPWPPARAGGRGAGGGYLRLVPHLGAQARLDPLWHTAGGRCRPIDLLEKATNACADTPLVASARPARTIFSTQPPYLTFFLCSLRSTPGLGDGISPYSDLVFEQAVSIGWVRFMTCIRSQVYRDRERPRAVPPPAYQKSAHHGQLQ